MSARTIGESWGMGKRAAAALCFSLRDCASILSDWHSCFRVVRRTGFGGLYDGSHT